MVELCSRAHPFYRRLMKCEGLEPRHLQTCDDLVRLPVSTKADFLADPEAFPVHRSLEDAVRVVERRRATVPWGVAGFVRRVLVRAAELGADFRAVRFAMITGEASSRAMRDYLRRRIRELGCAGNAVVNRYGPTEQGASMVECREGAGFHSLAPDTASHEVVDNRTGL